MATTKLSEKPVVTILDDEVRIFITTQEDVDGDMVDSIRRTTFPAFIEMLKKRGIDKSHFNEMRYDADTGMLHVLLNSKDVISPCYIGKFAEVDENKADLVGGVVPDAQLPHYNKSQNIYVGDKLLYPVVFFDVDSEGNFYLREDGRGEYLLYIPLDGVPRLKYIGNAVTDDVTGVSYSFSISDGKAVLKQIL